MTATTRPAHARCSARQYVSVLFAAWCVVVGTTYAIGGLDWALIMAVGANGYICGAWAGHARGVRDGRC